MAKGICMKNMDSQLQQLSSAVGDFQDWVDRLDISNQKNHYAIVTVDRKMEGGLNRMRDDINQMREEMGNQLQQFM